MDDKKRKKTMKRKHMKGGNADSMRTFTKKDYMSGDGMLTSVWGPSLWHFLHTMSFNYPVEPTVEQKQHYREFMLNLVHILPCRYCRENLKRNFKKLPLLISHMENRETFSRYVYELHEHVNKMLGKQSGLSYCDVRERYEHFRARCIIDIDLSGNPIYPSNSKQIISTNKTQKKSHKISKKNEKEKGCTEPLYGKKSKCVIRIVPFDNKEETLVIDERCLKKREISEEKEESK